jgi:hypothetical protein
MPLGFLPMVIGGLVECKLALARVQKFLLAEDMDESAVEHKESKDGNFLLSFYFMFLFVRLFKFIIPELT